MTEAPERIWTCSHLGEYGRYYPEAVEAEGEHGGMAVEYIRADHVDALLKAEREKALREAAGVCERIRTQKTNGPMPERACFDYEQSILDLIEKDATDG